MPLDITFSEMAASSDRAPANWRRPFLRWLDGIEFGWTVPGLIGAFIAAWLVFFSIAYLGGNLHEDMLETWTVGRAFIWGNSKHPPLMGWVVWVWTSLFPLTDFSFRLMAMLNSGLALWSVDLISRHFLKGDKRIVVLLLLMLLPTYQFFAQRFNANAVLLVPWPLATYFFLRSFESRRLACAAAAGAMTAIAMLGKYYSIFLVGSFVFAAVCHPQRRAYFTSGAPWVSAAAGLIVLAPHIYWLVTTGAEPFDYALERAGNSSGDAIHDALLFWPGLIAMLALPGVLWMLIAGHRLAKFPGDFRELNPGLWLLFLIAAGTVVFPPVAAVVLKAGMPSLWAEQGLFLFVILAVCGAGFPVERFHTVNLLAMVIGMAVIAVVVAAPINAVYRNSHPYAEGRNFYRDAAHEITRLWHEQSDVPLPTISGDDGLAYATAFYSPDRPVYYKPLTFYYPKLPLNDILRHGWVLMCFEGDAHFLQEMQASVGPFHFVRTEFVAQSHMLGWPGATRRIIAMIVPPEREERTEPATK